MAMDQSKYDGCLFYRIDKEESDLKAGRHIDDFLVTGPREQVDAFLAEAKEKLNMQDAVKLYDNGDQGRLLALNIVKVEGGFSLMGNPLLINDMAELLGMENAKTSDVPESRDPKKQEDDDHALEPARAGLYRSCVGKAMYLSHHRADIQHTVNRLTRVMQTPTEKHWRALKKLVRYLLGTKEVYQLLVPRDGAETLVMYTDSDWADDKDDRKSVSGGALMMYGCTILSYTRTQKTPALSSAEAELYAIGSGAVETLGTATLLKEFGIYDGVPVLRSDSQSALDVCRKRGPGRMKHIELKLLAIQEWTKEGRLTVRKVDTKENPSDVLTKAMTKELLTKHCWTLGLRGNTFGNDAW
jgi:hypothetical protein